ncbi:MULTISPECIES: hypothetical protein [unclassified Enterococcus]|jgi:hypothetical protein|uniref:hypothetical protein n=1 Tax=unclassified Enterococcus TaxID=2608891 RepID=UPI003D29F039
MIKEDSKVLYSDKPGFKKLVLQYGRKNIGKQITYDSFVTWLNKAGYGVYQYDKCWKAVFNSLLQHNFYTSVNYRISKDCNLVTVFQLNKK